MLGPLTIRRGGVPLPLPASRKVRALLAYLALAPHAVAREPAVRAAVGRPQRSARRAPLVPEQDQDAASTSRAGADRHRGGHGQARSGGLLRRCARGRRRRPRTIATIDPDRLRESRGAVRRRLSRRAGDRPQPGLRRLAHGAAAPVPRLPHGAAGAAGRRVRPDEERSALPGASGSSWRRSTGVCTSCLLSVLARSGRIREGEEHLAAAVRRSRPRGSTARRFATRGAPPEARERGSAAAPRLLVLRDAAPASGPMPMPLGGHLAAPRSR